MITVMFANINKLKGTTAMNCLKDFNVTNSSNTTYEFNFVFSFSFSFYGYGYFCCDKSKRPLSLS